MRFPTWNSLPPTQVGIRVQNHNHRHLPKPRHHWHFRLNLKQNHSKRQETWTVSWWIGKGFLFFLSLTHTTSFSSKEAKLGVVLASANMVLAVSIFAMIELKDKFEMQGASSLD